MRKRIGIGFVIILLMIFFTACSSEPTPEERMKKYINDWQEQHFEKMYEQLSNESQTSIAKDEFVERYEAIYDGIEARQIHVEAIFPEEGNVEPDEAGKVAIPYRLEMETLAGQVNFDDEITLVQEEGEEGIKWSVVWTPSLIFPSMEEGDEVRAERLEAKRGEIVDRNGKGLAVNGTVLDVGIVPERLPEDAAASIQKLSDIIGVVVEEIEKKLNASWVQPNFFVPIVSIAKDDERLDALMNIEGVTYQEKRARVYPYREAAAHMIGYVGEINAEELKERKDDGYHTGDIIGKTGLESVFEEQLRGKDGGRIYIVDQDGIEKDVIAETEPVDGETIAVTIDIDVQKRIYDEMNGDAGTAAAINPQSGEVLALVSSPAYDPNRFVLGLTNEEWNALNEDPKKPLLNRFAQTYAPGSVFKPVTAAIGLTTGAITPETTINVNGLTWQKESWGNYYVKRVSDYSEAIDLNKALVYSDNIYFAQAALAIGEEAFLKQAEKFGFGRQLPVEFPVESSQIVEKSFQNDIQLADSGYGQGQVEMSVLHVAISYTPFVNEGHLIAPRLVLGESEKDRVLWQENAISAEIAATIRQSLINVVNDPKGTASDVRIPGMSLAGKTGTAELKETKEEKGEENGWFVAFDNDNPDLLVAMMIESVEDRNGSHYVVSKVKPIFEALR